ncbi:hypothetical protein BC938DRAFT_473580 [Jimgerdemannia flammicorona]|uniref:Uncharacterized protein n=1 Tax=Jimgerdemannia flammicorona TaxID=994334 RepID=A0A433QZX3_9FUNG|nr:hypothetical protein BC938DRAFT_473580 [Jimgerdemannia flammicorona]
MPTEIPLTQVTIGHFNRQGSGLNFVPRWENKSFSIYIGEKELSLCFEALSNYQRQDNCLVLQLHPPPLGIRSLKFGPTTHTTPRPHHMTDTDPTRGQIYTAQDITLHLSDVTAALRLEALDRAMARAVGCKPRMQMEMDTVSSDLDRLVVNPRRATGTGTTTPPPTTNLGMSTPRIESSGLGNGNGMGNGNGNGMPTQSRRSFALDPFTPAAFPATESLTVSLSNLAQGQPIRTLSNSSTAPQSLPLPSTSSIFDAYPSAPVFDQTSPFVTRPVGSVGGTSAGLFGAADVVATTSAGGANQDVQGGQSSGLMAAALKYFAVRSKEVDEGALAGAGADGTPMVQGTNLDVLLSRHLPQMVGLWGGSAGVVVGRKLILRFRFIC